MESKYFDTKAMEITPVLAKEMLEKNIKNRKPSDKHVERLANAMRRGDWKFNGDTISFGQSGNLLDGQHRLLAVIKSGVSISTLVVHGLNDDVFDTKDVGKSRTASDALSVHGIKNYATIASGAKLIINLRKHSNPYASKDVSIVEIEEFVEQTPKIHDVASRVMSSIWTRKYLTPSLATLCMFVFEEKRGTESDAFFDRLEDGVGLSKGSPVLLLRDRLMSDKSDKVRMTASYKAALTFKAFRLFLDGAEIKYLRVRTEGESIEKELFVI